MIQIKHHIYAGIIILWLCFETTYYLEIVVVVIQSPSHV